MNKFLGSALAVALLFGGLGPVDAGEDAGGSVKLSGKIGKKKSKYAEEYMDQGGEGSQDISEIVDATSEEVRLLIEQAVADAVDSAVADNTDGGSIEDVVVVDSEGNNSKLYPLMRMVLLPSIFLEMTTLGVQSEEPMEAAVNKPRRN